MKKFTVYSLQFIVFTLYTLYFIPYTNPAYAKVDIGSVFGFGDIQSVGQLTSKLISPMFSIAAVLIIGYFLFGAFKYLKAGASKEDVEAAKQTITHAIIGFIILILSFFILQFLLSTLFGASKFNTIF